MMTPIIHDHRAPHYNALPEVQEGSDRACALVTAAITETAIETSIKARLLPEKEVLNALFQESGALGSFGSKATLARAMGIISQQAFLELKSIARIRNYFAHRPHIDSFASDANAAECKKFILVDLYYGDMTPEIETELTSFLPTGYIFEKTFYQVGNTAIMAVPRNRFAATAMLIAQAVSPRLSPDDRSLPYT